MVHGSVCGVGNRPDVGERTVLDLWMTAVPFKLNQDRRHHIPRQQHKVTN